MDPHCAQTPDQAEQAEIQRTFRYSSEARDQDDAASVDTSSPNTADQPANDEGIHIWRRAAYCGSGFEEHDGRNEEVLVVEDGI